MRARIVSHRLRDREAKEAALSVRRSKAKSGMKNGPGYLSKIDTDRLFARFAQLSVIALAILAIFYTLYFAKAFFLPTALAIIISLIGTPVVHRMERWRIPRYAAAGITVILLVLGLAVGGLALVPELQSWAARVPEITERLKGDLHVLRDLVATVENMTRKVQESVSADASLATAPTREVVGANQGVLAQVASIAPSFIAQLLYTLVLAFFLIAERRSVRTLALHIPRTFRMRLQLARTFRLMRLNVARYLFTIAVINMALGLIAGLVFFAIGVPSAGLWGAGVAVANFVPYFGPIVMVLIVFVVGYVSFDGIQYAIIAPLTLVALNFVEGNFVTPAIVGKRTKLRPLGVFIAIAFGAWIWGIGGAFVAVPATIVFYTLWQGLLPKPGGALGKSAVAPTREGLNPAFASDTAAPAE